MAGSKRLTDAFCTNLKLPTGKKELIVADTTKGLSLRLSASGARIWRFQYAYGDKAGQRITIGEFPTVKVDEAREKAETYNRLLYEGKDPKLATFDPKKAATLADILEAHLATIPKSEAATRSKYKEVLAAHGTRRLPDLDKKMFRDWISENYEHRPRTGKLLRANLSAAFALAIRNQEQGLADIELPPNYVNPIPSIDAIQWMKSYRPTKGFAKAFNAKEEQALKKGFEDAYQTETWAAGIMVLELGFHTGARPGEIASATWAELENFTVTEGEETIVGKRLRKSAHKNDEDGRDRDIFIFGEALKVIERAQELRTKMGYNGPYIFPVRRQQKNQKHGFVWQWTHYSQIVEKLCGVKFLPYNLRSGYINRLLTRFGEHQIGLVAKLCGNSPEVIFQHYRKHHDDAAAKLAFAATK